MSSDSINKPNMKPIVVSTVLLVLFCVAFVVGGPKIVEVMELACPKKDTFVVAALAVMAIGCQQSYRRGWNDRDKEKGE